MRRNGGFLLADVMIALATAGILLAMLPLFKVTAEASRRNGNMLTAAFLAQRELAALQGDKRSGRLSVGAAVPPKTVSINDSDFNVQCDWQGVVDGDSLRKLVITVRWTERVDERQLALEAVL